MGRTPYGHSLHAQARLTTVPGGVEGPVSASAIPGTYIPAISCVSSFPSRCQDCRELQGALGTGTGKSGTFKELKIDSWIGVPASCCPLG